jgi:outer membrane protein assembly factor BamB
MMAIRITGAKGDLTNTDRILWKSQFRPPYVPSPLLVDDTLYYLRHYQNILTRRNAGTGEESSGPFRLAGLLNIYASPVAAGGNIYITDQQGNTLVIDHKDPRPITLNQLNESINASAAVIGKDLLLRGIRHLYCISSDQ